MMKDAMAIRENLAAELREWNSRGYFRPERAERFYRRVRRLAKMTGLSRAQVMADLEADARRMAEEE